MPDAFEAEERSIPGLGDLLHIVSGRTLIGIVRERRTDRLDDGAKSMHAHLKSASQQWLEGTPGFSQPVPSCNTSSSECRHDSFEKGPCSSILSLQHPTGPDSEDSSAHAPEECCHISDKAGTDVFWQADLSREQDGRPTSQILELVLQDELVAVAVRQKTSVASMCSSSHTTGDAQQGQSSCASGKGKGGYRAGDSSRNIISMYTVEGQLLCNLDDGQLHGGCLDGRVKFSVIRSATPLVRHLYFVAEAGLFP